MSCWLNTCGTTFGTWLVSFRTLLNSRAASSSCTLTPKEDYFWRVVNSVNAVKPLETISPGTFDSEWSPGIEHNLLAASAFIAEDTLFGGMVWVA